MGIKIKPGEKIKLGNKRPGFFQSGQENIMIYNFFGKK
jgi:hypothetical protein